MGDAGALFLGLLLAVPTITIGGRTDFAFSGSTYFFFAPLLIPIVILGVPILDTVFSFVRRLFVAPEVAPRPTPGHLHHRLMRLGHGPRRSVVILWAWTAILSGVALLPVYTNEGNALVPFAAAAARCSACTSGSTPDGGLARLESERNRHPTGRRRAEPASSTSRRAVANGRRLPVARGRSSSMESLSKIRLRFDWLQKPHRRLRIHSQAAVSTVAGAVGRGNFGRLQPVELRDRQATWQGFGDALALGVEIVVTPLLFALFGWWLDGRFGTGPVLAIAFGAVRRRRRMPCASTTSTGRAWNAKRKASRGRDPGRRARHRARPRQARAARQSRRRARRRAHPAASKARSAPRSRSRSCSRTSSPPRTVVSWAAHDLAQGGGHRRARSATSCASRSSSRALFAVARRVVDRLRRRSASRSSAPTSACSPGRRST